MKDTLHFEYLDPSSSDRQRPIGAPCHGGSISPSGGSRNSSFLPPTIFAPLSLPHSVIRAYDRLKVGGADIKTGQDKVLLAVTRVKY